MSQLDQIWQEPRPAPGTSEAMETLAPRTVQARRPRRTLVQLAVLGVAVAIAAAVVAWLLVRNGSHASPPPTPGSGPALVSQAQLERLAGSLDHPLYWAGPKSGYSYELTNLSGRTYVRYLPSGIRAGDSRADFLVVGTYARPGAYADLKRASKQKGSVSFGIPNDGLAAFSPAKPTSVYFSYPGKAYQVEVYSPSGEAARSLVLAGKITPIR
jgi:hypothetical protein